MSVIKNAQPKVSSDERSLLDDLNDLFQVADDIWERKNGEAAFHGYVSADYLSLYETLRQHQGKATTFLEWGSGLGVATIMASRMGFDAYGIEAEEGLVEISHQLAAQYGPDAKFAVGSFIPDEFEWEPSGDEDIDRTEVDAAAAYYLIDMEIRDFDLVYAYPWPDEHGLFKSIFRQFSQPGATFITYDSREGIQTSEAPSS
jgi:hypothetical protein